MTNNKVFETNTMKAERLESFCRPKDAKIQKLICALPKWAQAL